MALSDKEVEKQIKQMMAFIDQEANEKVEEIEAKAEEEFNIEKGRLVQQERVKIMEFYDRKEKQVELQKKILNSNLLNHARLKVLRTKEDNIRQLLDSAKGRLSSISQDPNRYSQLLESLISQALCQLLEPTVIIRTRKQDLNITKSVVDRAAQKYKSITGLDIRIALDTEHFLPADSAGGVEVIAQKGKIRCSNTLENRLDMISQQIDFHHSPINVMYNLKPSSICCFSDTGFRNVHTLAFDDDTIYAAGKACVTFLDSDKGESSIGTIDLAERGLIEADDSIIAIEYMYDQRSLCIVLFHGGLFQWNRNTDRPNDIESVGVVDGEILSAALSPDGDILALVTRHKLLLMTQQFDVLHEADLLSTDQAESELIAVGWGLKETQFDIKDTEIKMPWKQNTTLSPQTFTLSDTSSSNISWLSDGQYLATSVYNPFLKSRQVLIWSREGLLQARCEHLDKLGACLSWRSNKQFVCCHQLNPDQNQTKILFFERNGLCYSEFFPLQLNIKDICWHSQSIQLCIWCENCTKDAEYSSVLIYTTNNNHWYLKQKFDFALNRKITCVRWDHLDRLIICCADSTLYRYKWHREINNCLTDESRAYVVDGDHIKVTPFAQRIIPPSLCAYKILFPHATISHIAASSDGLGLAVLTSSGMLYLLSYQTPGLFIANPTNLSDSISITADNGLYDSSTSLPSIMSSISCSKVLFEHPIDVLSLHWLRNDCIVFILCSPNGASLPKFKIKVCDQALNMRYEEDLPTTPVSFASTPSGCLFLQLDDRQLYCYNPEDEVARLKQFTPCPSLPSLCSKLGVVETQSNPIIIGHNRQRHLLYINGNEVCLNCSSVFILGEFLLFTTFSHKIYCVNKPLLVDFVEENRFDFTLDETLCRDVEQNSVIVGAVPSQMKVILQMPRGNLETIFPRPLVLSRLKQKLNNLEYLAAFEVMRKHRVDMRLFLNHNPTAFLNNTDKFIEQLNSAERINLFLADLSKDSSISDDSSSESDKLFQILIKKLSSIDSKKYITSLITCYVKKSPSDIESALQLVYRSKEVETIAKDALDYLMVLVNTEELFNCALGSFNFDLVTMVAERSQKDPREYIPFLNDLLQHQSPYREFRIDCHLRRYESALRHLLKCEEDRQAESFRFIEQHSLHNTAIELLNPKTSMYKDVCCAYGDVLKSKSCFSEAAIVFEKAFSFKKAIDCYRLASNWRSAVSLIERAGFSPQERQTVILQLADNMKQANDFVGSAIIYEQYALDCEQAIAVLIEGHNWDEAIRLIDKFGREDLYETHFKLALDNAYTAALEQISKMLTNFSKHKCRLGVVRQSKEKEWLELLAEGAAVTNADLVSEISSVTAVSDISSRASKISSSSSAFSKATGRTAKNKRKAERKKWSTKEGSRFEHNGLVEELSAIIRQADKMKEEINDLLRSLVRFDANKRRATKLQQEFEKLLKGISDDIPEIWLPEQDFFESYGYTASFFSMQQTESHQSMAHMLSLDRSLRCPPIFRESIKWKLEILK